MQINSNKSVPQTGGTFTGNITLPAGSVTSAPLSISTDLFLTRAGAANPQWGLNSATPVAQTHNLAPSARGGTDTDVAGANATIKPGNGTGTGGSGSIIFQIAPAGTTGTTANTMYTAAQIDKTGALTLPFAQAMNSGAMTYASQAVVTKTMHKFTWTNAMVSGLGAVTAANINVCVLPAKTVVTDAFIVINTPDTSANALTVSLGRTAANYIDYIVASDAKAAANTVYGDASAERGTNLTGFDLPSYTGTTTVVARFTKTTSNLNTVTGSTGTVYLETMTLP